MSVSERQRELLTELGHPPDYEPDQGTPETEFLYKVYVALRSLESAARATADEAGERAVGVRDRYEALFAERAREASEDE